MTACGMGLGGMAYACMTACGMGLEGMRMGLSVLWAWFWAPRIHLAGDPLLKLARSCYHGWKDKWAHLDHALQQISDFNNGDMSLIAGLYFSACAGAGPRTGRREFEIEWDTREELGKLFGKAIKVCTLSKTYAATLADQAYQAVAAGWDQKWQLIEFASSQAHLMNPQDKKRLAEIFQKAYDGGWHTGTLCNQKIGPFLR